MFPEHSLGGNRIGMRFDLNCIPSGELFLFVLVRTYQTKTPLYEVQIYWRSHLPQAKVLI